MTIMRSLTTALLLLAAPLLSLAQSIGGLTARATASSIALRPTSLEGAAIEDLQFSYSQDAGATWKPIEASCLEFVSGEAIWHVLECLQVDVFEGSNFQFKASLRACKPVTFDFYSYEVVQIGSKCWFAENLRSTHYANGDAISGNLTIEEWKSTRLGAHAVYENNAAYLNAYGRLYNWYAVDDARGLCPSDWHVPTDSEYMTLEMEYGMSSSVAISTGWRVAEQGEHLKAPSKDSPSWNGTDNSGFSALPGGFRNYNGSYNSVGSYAYFWSSSLYRTNAWYRYLNSKVDDVHRGNYNLRSGFSVRCVRD